jgi:hypothetical protein
MAVSISSSAKSTTERKSAVILAFVFCEFAAVADWLTTFLLVDGVHYVEHNPVASWIIAHGGFAVWLGVKLIYVPLGAVLGGRLVTLLRPNRGFWGSAAFFFWVVGGAQLLAALHNFYLT